MTRRTSWLGVLGGILLLAAPAAGQLAVAWNRTDGTAESGWLRSRAPWTLRAGSAITDRHAVLAAAGRRHLLVLSRDPGALSVVDLRGWHVRHQLSVPKAEDVVASGPCTAWVTRRGSARLLRVDLCAGTAVEATDLSAFADADGDPDLGAMAVDGHRLFVQVRRQNEKLVNRFAPPAYLAVVDTRSGALIDTDPVTPGVQAITLAGTAPKHRMQIVASVRRLFVSATGGFFDAGGLEAIDLDGLRSDGLVIRESDGRTGADLGPFVMVTPERGFVVYSTDFDLSSHLQPFTIERGVREGPELHVSLGYAVPSLIVDPLTNTLFLADGVFGRRGVFAFDATSGARLTTHPTAVDGMPTDLILLRRP